MVNTVKFFKFLWSKPEEVLTLPGLVHVKGEHVIIRGTAKNFVRFALSCLVFEIWAFLRNVIFVVKISEGPRPHLSPFLDGGGRVTGVFYN